MTYKTYTTSQFIVKFNFPNPSWDNLPVGFPNLTKKGLSKEEGHLLDAIKLAWATTTQEGRSHLFRRVRLGFLSLVFLISLIGLISLISSSQEIITKPVSAATAQVDELIQSTVSAILRK